MRVRAVREIFGGEVREPRERFKICQPILRTLATAGREAKLGPQGSANEGARWYRSTRAKARRVTADSRQEWGERPVVSKAAVWITNPKRSQFLSPNAKPPGVWAGIRLPRTGHAGGQARLCVCDMMKRKTGRRPVVGGEQPLMR